jgi:hypothetical protein
VNAHERLDAAREATYDGKQEFALKEFIWFHDNALAEEPSLYGVRLSYALSYWIELGEQYPTALIALREIRNLKSDKLVSGDGTRELFHDVCAIDRVLDERVASADLFEQIDHEQPAFAKQCADLAFEALVASKRFELAAKHVSDEEARVRRLVERLEECIAWSEEEKLDDDFQLRAFATIFVNDLDLICEVLSETDRSSQSKRLKALALSLIGSASAREAVDNVLNR